MAIYFPTIWIGFSMMPKDCQRSWLEVTRHSIRFGEILYSVGISKWSPVEREKRLRYLLVVEQKSEELAKKLIAWEVNNNRFWKRYRFVLNKPGRMRPWIKGHFRTWPYEKYEHER
jgi:hypothetical protein